MDADRSLLIQNLALTWRYSVGNPYQQFSFPEGGTSLDHASAGLPGRGPPNPARFSYATAVPELEDGPEAGRFRLYYRFSIVPTSSP